jgi:hypothetical protein
MMHEWDAALLARRAIEAVDRAHVRGLPRPQAPLSRAWRDVQEQRLRIARESIRHPEVDPQFDLVLLRHRGVVHGLVATEHADWRLAWLDRPEVSEYAWWNGSDRPGDVSPEDWAARGALWREMIPDLWPAGHGAIVHLTPAQVHSTPEEVLLKVPDMDARRRHAADELAIDAQAAKIASGDAVHATLRAAAWLRTEEGRTERDRLAASLELPEADLQTLIGRPPPPAP